jgi:putative ABC transport system permease protein
VHKEFMLAFAGVRKEKGHTVSLFLMFLISALVFNAGLLVLLNFGSYFEKVAKELNASDTYLILPTRFYNQDVKQFISGNSVVRSLQTENSAGGNATIPYNGDKRDISILLNNADVKRNVSRWKFVGEHLAPEGDMPAYVPYVMNIDGNYHLNDKLTVTFGNQTKITFTIKGFTDDIFFSSFDTGYLGFYLPEQTMKSVEEKLGSDYEKTLIFANVTEQENNLASGVKEMLQNKQLISVTDADNLIVSIGLPLIQMSRTLMASVIASLMVSFAAIVVLVCLSVIRFRIATSIDDDMLKIGSLKAIGYTSRQIMASVILQFTSVAVLGSIVGILLSYLTTPALSDVFAHQSGLLWEQGFDPVVGSITLCFILAVVLLVSFLSTRRIRRLNPIVALRGGIVTHSFRKNYLPLQKSKGRLTFLLGMKSMLQNKKVSIMVAFILVFVSFMSAFSVVLYYNSAVDTSKFAQVPGIEQSDVEAYFNPGIDQNEIVNQIKKMSGVRKVQYIDRVTGRAENTTIYLYTMDDFSQKETSTIYDGRYPCHDNEVAMGGVMARTMNKKIGDTITLKIGTRQQDYLITGFTQGITMGGSTAFLTREGVLKLNPNFEQQSLEIYLNDKTKSAEFVKTLNRQYGKSFVAVVDANKAFEQGMGAYTSVISEVGIVIFLVTTLIVILVLYFVVNSSITRQKRTLGIQKAIGYTTFQLMNQVSLSFLIPVAAGVLIGSVLGITQTNNVMSFAESAVYIAKADYIITPGWIALCGLSILALSYVISLLVTYRIRKISAYTLISE